MRRLIILLIILIVAFSTIVSAKCPEPKEGYTTTEDCMTTYKLDDLKALWGNDNVIEPGLDFESPEIAKQAPGYIEIFHAKGQPLIKVNGTIIVDLDGEKMAVWGGSVQVAMQQEKGKYVYKALVSGKKLEVRGIIKTGKGAVKKYNLTVEPGNFRLMGDESGLISGKTETGYWWMEYEDYGESVYLRFRRNASVSYRDGNITIDCSVPVEDQCRIAANPEFIDGELEIDWSLVYGDGKIVDSRNDMEFDIANFYIEKFASKPNAVVLFGSSKFSEISPQKIPRSLFGPFVFNTDGTLNLVYEKGNEESAGLPLAIFIAGEEPVDLEIGDTSGAVTAVYAGYPDGTEEGIMIDNGQYGKLNIRGGAFFVSAEDLPISLEQLSSHGYNIGYIYRDGSTYKLFIGLKEFTFAPSKDERETLEPDGDVVLELPKDSKIKRIELEKIGAGEGSKLVLESEKVPESRMVFTYDNVVVEGDANWFDFGVSFSTYIYDKAAFEYKILECEIGNPNVCTLGGNPISDLTEIKKPVECSSDEDCGDRKCVEIEDSGKLVCQYVPECIKFSGEDDKEKKLNIVVLGDGFGSNEEFEVEIERFFGKPETPGSFFSMSPFKEDVNKFTIWKLLPTAEMVIPALKNPYDMRLPILDLKKSYCSYANQIVVITKTDVHAWASFSDDLLFVSSLSDTGVTLAHEFGHSFGDLADEYHKLASGYSGNPGKPNCLRSKKEAMASWKKYLGEQEAKKLLDVAAEEYLGCGGYCDDRCEDYIRPSETSIMRDSGGSGGGFNPVCLAKLNEELKNYA